MNDAQRLALLKCRPIGQNIRLILPSWRIAYPGWEIQFSIQPEANVTAGDVRDFADTLFSRELDEFVINEDGSIMLKIQQSEASVVALQNLLSWLLPKA